MRIIENEDARRFNFEATLYDFTDLGHRISPKVRLEIVNPVPVYIEGRRLVGYASLYVDRQAEKLRGMAFVDYATPERLSIETGELVYALPDGDFSVSAQTNEVDGIWVPHIHLGRHQPFPGIGGTCRPFTPSWETEIAFSKT